MKKSLIALAVLAFAAAAQAAGSITVEQEHFSYRNSPRFLNGTSVIGTYQINEKYNLWVDGKHQFGKMNDGSAFNTNEAGVRKDFVLNDRVTLGLRGATGRMYPQGAATVGYYLVDPTVTYSVTPKLNVTAGYRWRNNTAGGFVTHSPMAWADYSLTQKDVLSLGFTRIQGALEAKSVTMSYTRLF